MKYTIPHEWFRKRCKSTRRWATTYGARFECLETKKDCFKSNCPAFKELAELQKKGGKN